MKVSKEENPEMIHIMLVKYPNQLFYKNHVSTL